MDTGDFSRESTPDPLGKRGLWPMAHRPSVPAVRRPTVGGDHTVRIHHAMGGAHALLDVDGSTGDALRLSLRIDLIEVCLRARPGHGAEDLFLRAALAVARGARGLPDDVARRYFLCAAELERRCRRSLTAAGPPAGSC